MPLYTRQSMGGSEELPSAIAQASILDEYQPETSDVLGAYVEDAFQGVGTLNADNLRFQVRDLEKVGTPLDEETFKTSFGDSGISYYKGITQESAQVLADYNKEQQKRSFIISKASTTQDIAGFGSAFATGIFEPKNLLIGVATAAIGGPLISKGLGVGRIAALEASLGRYGSKAAIGGVEGLVSAAIAEPSNQYSAKILQQDYGMADSMWNIGLSAVLGVGLNTAPSFIKDRFAARKFRKADLVETIKQEVDTATAQLSQGQRVDVSAVEKIVDGAVAKKSVAEKAATIEKFVKYTESPEFKGKFEGSKVVDAEGAPLRVYHGTRGDFAEFDKEFITRGAYGSGFYFTPEPKVASSYATNKEGSNVRPVYLSLKNPATPDQVRAAELNYNGSNRPGSTAYEDEVTSALKEQGFDGVKLEIKGLNPQYVAFNPDQIIPAFGEGDMNTIAKQIDADNGKEAAKAVQAAHDPNNDTAIDQQAAQALDEYDMMAEQDELAAYESEIASLREQGLLTEADEMAMEALAGYSEADTKAAYDAAYFCLTRG